MRLPHETVSHLRDVLARPELPGDRYELHELVGAGGMGAVYRATDRTLGRDVALKVLRPELAADGSPHGSVHGFAERLRREAAVLARLEHPGVVPVHEVGQLADGRLFYVMRLVRGARLDEFALGAALAARLRVFLRICETTSFAHARGVVHRDLKPSNVMVGAFGEVLVLDWGIARVLGERAGADGNGREPAGTVVEPPGSADTHEGTVLGTPGFMSPEQSRGDTAAIDARSDVYALGAILRYLTTDSAPGERSARALVSIWRKACAPAPEDRYPTGDALAADVTRFLDREPVSAHREGWVERAGRIYQKYQTAILLVVAYLAMRLLFLLTRGL